MATTRPARCALVTTLVLLRGKRADRSACSRDPQALKARYLASAENYANKGKLAEAAIEYQNALQGRSARRRGPIEAGGNLRQGRRRADRAAAELRAGG